MQGDMFRTQEALSDAEFSAVLREAEQYQRGIRDCVDRPDTSISGVPVDAKQQTLFREV